MAETLEKIIVKKDLPKQRLEKYLATHNIPIAKTSEELLAHSVVDDKGEEVDEFLKTLAEWRSEKYESRAELD